MKRIRLILIVLQGLIFSSATGQYSIHIQVDSMPTSRAYLYEFVGDRTGEIVDSVHTTQAGHVMFELPANAHPGMYRMVMGPRTWLDFIFNKEDIVLHTHFNTPVDSLKVKSSKENDLWNGYMNYFLIMNRKQEYLSRLLSVYNPSDPFYKSIEQELAGVRQTDPETVSKKIIKNNPDSYVARMLKIEQSPQVPLGLSMDEERDYILENFFSGIDFTDSTLMYSPPLISRVRNYFGLFQRAYPPDEVEEAMIGGLNRLLSKAAISDPLYDFLLEELAQMFERSEFETFFAYFMENFLLGASCKDESRNLKLAETLAAIQKTAIGNISPEVILPLPSGPLILSEMKEPLIMVLFWASWCQHCNEMLPEIRKIYEQYKSKGFEVISISLDEDPKEYQKAIDSGHYSWINYSELKGWDCSIAYDFGIRATPTMILMDQNKRIIGKPRNPQHLRQLISNLL